MLKSNTKLFKMPGILVPPCFLHPPAGRKDILSRDPDWPELALCIINNLNTYTHKHTPHRHTPTHPASIQSQECRNQYSPAGLFQNESHNTTQKDAGHADNGPPPVPSFPGASFLGESGRCSLFSQEAVP